MKNILSILCIGIFAFSMYSCKKETISPSSEEGVVYEHTFMATERNSNTASITWTSTAAVDARFEVEDVATGTVLYSYGWINFTSATQTATYTVTTGNTVRLRIKARKVNNATSPVLNYTFSSTCTITGSGSGSLNVTAPAGWAWGSNPGNALTTGGCL